MNFPQKEFVNFGLKVSFFLNLITFYVIYEIFRSLQVKIRNRFIQKHQNGQIEEYNAVSIELNEIPPLPDNINQEGSSNTSTMRSPSEVHINIGYEEVIYGHNEEQNHMVTIDSGFESIVNSEQNEIYDPNKHNPIDTPALENMVEFVSFTTRLQLCFLKLLKLNYTPIATFSFKMINCIAIRESLHLYVCGDQVCYTWWQLLIFAVILPWLILLPFCMEMSFRILIKGKVSSRRFLLSTMVPLYAIWLYVNKQCYSSRKGLSLIHI